MSHTITLYEHCLFSDVCEPVYVPDYYVINRNRQECIKRALLYVVLLKISENLNIPHKPFVLRTYAATCLLLYLSTISQPTGVFMRVRVSEFWLFS
jgi:hypothetical protein